MNGNEDVEVGVKCVRMHEITRVQVSIACQAADCIAFQSTQGIALTCTKKRGAWTDSVL